MEKKVRKSSVVSVPILSAVAMLTGCGPRTPTVNVHLDASGNCVSDAGQIVEQRVCYGHGGGYYGGMHYVYLPFRSAPYYANPASPGYVRPWGGGASVRPGSVSGSGTVRGVFGGFGGGGA